MLAVCVFACVAHTWSDVRVSLNCCYRSAFVIGDRRCQIRERRCCEGGKSRLLSPCELRFGCTAVATLPRYVTVSLGTAVL